MVHYWRFQEWIGDTSTGKGWRRCYDVVELLLVALFA